MLEEERKYAVDNRFALPDLSSCLPAGGQLVAQPPVTLTATYYDTTDLRLARSGASLRHRRGDAAPWTVKLPTGAPGVRHEISRAGLPGALPAELVALVTAVHRGAPLAPVAVLRTRRRAFELRDSDDRLLAEVVDDAVTVLDGRKVVRRFREVEVERAGGRRKLLDRVGVALLAAGATVDGFTPKHVRALGPAATRPPDLVPPAPLGKHPTAGAVVTSAIRRDIVRLLAHDPLVRLRAPVGADDTAVHQMRVGCRRLRSDLRTFRALLDTGWANRLRGELSWLADALGGVRDAEVLRDRLRSTAAADPLSPPDSTAVTRLDADLAARYEDALVELDAALATDRYLALVNDLVEAARAPQLTTAAQASARKVLPRLVSGPWRRLAYGDRGLDGAADLAPDAADERWHAVRIRAKRARYAVDAVAAVVGGEAPALAKALGAVQDLLGEHQDAAVAADAWLNVSLADPDDHALAVTAGRLYERERTAIRRVRTAFPSAWRAASRRSMVRWLP